MSATSRGMTLVAAAIAVIAAAPVDAPAACGSPAQATRRIADAPSDGDRGLAPEISAVDVRVDAACRLVVAPAFADRSPTAGLFPREGATTYLDTDGDARTGSPAWGGADVAVVVAGRLGDPAGPAIGRWSGGRFRFDGAGAVPAVGIGGFRATLDQLGITRPEALRVRVATSWMGVLGTYRDFAPDLGAPPAHMPVTLGGMPVLVASALSRPVPFP